MIKFGMIPEARAVRLSRKERDVLEVIALGLVHYGRKRSIEALFEGLFSAATYMDVGRLPELFCGFKRGYGSTLYPVACLPRIRLAIRQRTRMLERWPKQALLMRGRFTAKMWKRSSVCPGCQKRSVAVDPPVRYSPWVTQAHICAYYAA